MPEEDEGSSPTSLPDINTGGAPPPRSSPQPGTSKQPPRSVGLLSLFLPYCLRRVLGSRSLLVVYIFTSTKSPRGPPWNEGHQPKVCHETSVFEVPVQEQHEHSFFSSSTNTFITGSLYTVRRYCTSPGAPDLQARLG